MKRKVWALLGLLAIGYATLGGGYARLTVDCPPAVSDVTGQLPTRSEECRRRDLEWWAVSVIGSVTVLAVHLVLRRL